MTAYASRNKPSTELHLTNMRQSLWLHKIWVIRTQLLEAGTNLDHLLESLTWKIDLQTDPNKKAVTQRRQILCQLHTLCALKYNSSVITSGRCVWFFFHLVFPVCGWHTVTFNSRCEAVRCWQMKMIIFFMWCKVSHIFTFFLLWLHRIFWMFVEALNIIEKQTESQITVFACLVPWLTLTYLSYHVYLSFNQNLQKLTQAILNALLY